MNKLEDEKNLLLWLKSSELNSELGKNISNEVNSWSKSTKVKRYITSAMPLDDFLKTFTTTTLKNSKPNDSLFYCFEDNQLVGAILLGNASFAPSIYHIDYLVVNPKLHNKGYGTRMIKSVISNPDFFNNGTTPKLYISHS
ncbi:MAG: GNAT family N-acetyltransferase, partial [Christensenellales bacterium]